ncbi:rhamnan synthesis F family protein [Rhizobium oryziradicis]|uniref:Uncharacterized protein n=1 Tax=Rhizobium oryziradicis TaxID=1867956 RepID=A0A1Q8ZYD6_9HYPH|nr:rhamnan synthesis F family protein [Rhizobium oryziradicis]OLP46926.1 hypothetical protein BJF95_02185 [Rhizobium oryziradicis]
MVDISVPTASFSLDEGFYRLTLRGGTPADVVQLIDRDNPSRGCVLFSRQSGQTYLLKLKRPLSAGMITVNSPAGEGASGATPISLHCSKISKAMYYGAGLAALTKPRRLQRFGPGEKLVVRGGTAQDLALFASQNVEFRYLRLYGLDNRSVDARGWQWLLDAERPVSGQKQPAHSEVSGRICVYVHMHYWETWPEIEAILSNDCEGADLIVTSSVDASQHFSKIAQRFPHAQLVATENRGRDVGPFLEMLSKGMFDQYTAVCKIHGKLSKKDGRETAIGLRVRRYILASLLANGNFRQATEAFAAKPALGLLGPQNLLLPPRGGNIKAYIKSEWSIMQRVFARANIEIDPKDIQFFVGTMFWFRPRAFSGLQKLGIGLGDFDAENGKKRSTLQHAFERMFCAFVQNAGYTVDVISPP